MSDEREIKILHVSVVGNKRTCCGRKSKGALGYGTKFAPDWRFCRRCMPHAVGMWVRLDKDNRLIPNPPLGVTSTTSSATVVWQLNQTSTAA